MLCPRCHTQMQVVTYRASTGTDGRTTETQHRCVKCWHHETVREKRKPADFQGKVNL